MDWINKKNKEIFSIQNFFLDKNKKIKHIDNYRIIMISPIGIKFFEEYIQKNR